VRSSQYPEDLQAVPESVMRVMEDRFGHLEDREKYKRMRLSWKRQQANKAKKPNEQYKHSKEMRMRISKATKEAMARPEVKQKMVDRKGGSLPEETRKKIGESVSKTYKAMPKEKKAKSEEHRRKISEAIRKKWEDREYREKAVTGMSHAMQKKWEDPAYRSKKEAAGGSAAGGGTRLATAADIKATRSRGGGGGGGGRRAKPAPITEEAEAIIQSAQRIQDSKTKLIKIATAVEKLAHSANADEKTIKQARESLNIARSRITLLEDKTKKQLRKYLDISTGKMGRRALMKDVFDQFALTEVYNEVLESFTIKGQKKLAAAKDTTDHSVEHSQEGLSESTDDSGSNAKSVPAPPKEKFADEVHLDLGSMLLED